MAMQAPMDPKKAVDPASWNELWDQGVPKCTYWDVGGASQTLSAALSRKSYAGKPGLKALVPGCGRAYDALALAQHGFEHVLAADIATSAVKAAQEELAAHASDAAASRVEIREADFFELEGPFDLIWDCTFLCALPPSMREKWAQKQSSLLSPTGVLIQCVFPINAEKDPNVGPPYPLTIELCKSLLEPTGLVASEVRETLPDEEKHRTSGNAATADTGFIEWRRSAPEAAS